MINKNTFTNCKEINKLILKKFNQPLDGSNSLPNSLTHLELLSFNQVIRGYNNYRSLLPSNLKYLNLLKFQDKFRDSILPNSIETLFIDINWLSIYPKSLTSISSTTYQDSDSLNFDIFQPFKEINLNHCSRAIVPNCKRFDPNPIGSVHLYFHLDNNNNNNNNEKKEDFHPTSIKTIDIKIRYFNWSIIKEFKYLKEIVFDNDSVFNKQLYKGMLPNTIERLEFGSHWNNGGYLDNKDITTGLFPNSIKYLKFGKCYCTTIGLDVLPSSLIQLTLPRESLLVIPRNTSLNFKLIIA